MSLRGVSFEIPNEPGRVLIDILEISVEQMNDRNHVRNKKSRCGSAVL